METDRKQDPCCAAEKSSSLPGPGRARTQEGCPATWARFQEGVEASSKGRPEGGWNRRSQSWGGEAELRRERRVGRLWQFHLPLWGHLGSLESWGLAEETRDFGKE